MKIEANKLNRGIRITFGLLVLGAAVWNLGNAADVYARLCGTYPLATNAPGYEPRLGTILTVTEPIQFLLGLLMWPLGLGLFWDRQWTAALARVYSMAYLGLLAGKHLYLFWLVFDRRNVFSAEEFPYALAGNVFLFGMYAWWPLLLWFCIGPAGVCRNSTSEIDVGV